MSTRHVIYYLCRHYLYVTQHFSADPKCSLYGPHLGSPGLDTKSLLHQYIVYMRKILYLHFLLLNQLIVEFHHFLKHPHDGYLFQGYVLYGEITLKMKNFFF